MAETERFIPTGGLDQDNDASFVKSGDSTSAANIRYVTTDTESGIAAIPIRGNKSAFDLPEITGHNKIFRIYFESTVSTPRELTIQYNDGSLLGVVSYMDGATISNTRSNFRATASYVISLATIPQTISYTSGSNYDDIEIQGVYNPFTDANVGYDYNVLSTGANDVTVTIIQEGVPVSLGGQLRVIGSFDLLEDLFVFSTPETNLPTALDQSIVAASNPSAPSPIVITTDFPNPLVNGDQVVISGVLGQTGANGKFIVNVLTDTTFELINSTPSGVFVSSPDSIITLYSESIGQIGVMQYLPNTDIYRYFPLLTSKEFGFRTKKQIDSFAEKNNLQTNLYFTDDLNPPRAFYYTGDYIDDGALTYVNSLGKYSYGSISDETQLFINASETTFVWTGQQQTGGAVKSGNWRYAIRLLTENFVGTDYSDLSNPINVFVSSTLGAASQISGDDSSTTTPKINLFTVDSIPANVFKYVELAAVNYIDLTQVGYVISRTRISQDQTSLDIQHTGFETDVTPLDLGLLNQRTPVYNTALNIDAINNRLILSNLTTASLIDFGSWTQTWTHEINRADISQVGDLFGGNLTVNEFQLPEIVYSKMSFMANEVYRLSAKFKLKNGTITQNFWIDDIAITTDANNVGADGNAITLPSRRVSGLTNYDLTSSTDTTWVYTIKFNFDIDATINGVSIRSLVDTIMIEQVEMIPARQEIISTGVFILGVEADDLSNTTEGFTSDGKGLTYKDIGVSLRIGEYFFITGEDNGSFPTYNPGPSFGNSVHAVAKRRHLAFYSPDSIYGLSDVTLASGQDKIINFGNPNKQYSHTEASATPHYSSAYAAYLGQTSTINPQLSDVNELQFYTNTDITIGGEIYTKVLTSKTGSDINTWINKEGYVVYSSADLTNVGANTDLGFYYGQYYRPRVYDASNPDINKFGDRNTTKYVSTGASLKITSSLPSNTSVTSYGDVYNQKTYFKNRFANSSNVYAMNPDGLGWDGGFSFYSQNRVNTQMTKRYDSPESTWIYPNTTFANWMEQGGEGVATLPTYNHGYDNRNQINANIAFNTNTPVQDDLPTRIIWSELKPQGSLTDSFRNFLALNFHDLEPTYGEIVHHANANGELVTWQQRKLQRQYFNTRGQLQTTDNLNVLIGDGAVLSRDGNTLSVIGTKHKWSIIKGKSAQGNDVFYWINTELKKVMRLGYDGTISLADIRGMQSFFANNLKWVDQFTTPADEFGICGFWCDRYNEAGWTVRARREEDDWVTDSFYAEGSVVKLEDQPDGTFSTFEQIGDLYLCIADHTSGSSTEPETGVDWETYWEKIPQTNTDYFNEYTIVFSEVRNKFQAFYAFKPKIYLTWRDTYFSPRPIADQGKIYIHDIGEYLTWYDDGSTSQTEDAHIEGVINKNEQVTKWYSAIDVDSDVTPDRIEFTTKQHISYLNAAEFENRENGSFSPIKSDTTTSGDNTSDTTLLYGRWLKVRQIFKVATGYNKLVSIIVKYKPGTRLFNT